MVAVIADVVPLVALKPGTFPVPLALSPMLVLLLVQVKVAPAGTLVKLVPATAVPGHTVLFAGTVAGFTIGLGLTVMVKVFDVPAQPFTVGVTVMVPVMGVLPELVEVKPGTLPVPLAPSPMEVLLFVQAKVPPVGVLVKVDAGTATPGHTLILAGTLATGIGLTVIV